MESFSMFKVYIDFAQHHVGFGSTTQSLDEGWVEVESSVAILHTMIISRNDFEQKIQDLYLFIAK